MPMIRFPNEWLEEPTHSPGNRSGGQSAADLRTIQQAKLLFAISNGQVEGVPHTSAGLKDVFLNDVPVQNPDGTFNFNGLTVAMTSGTLTQPPIPGWSDTESLTGSGALISNSSPQTVSVPASGATALRLNLNLNALYQVDSGSGKVSGDSVELRFEISNNGGAYTNITNSVDSQYGRIGGQSTGAVARSYRVPLTRYGSGPWTVRVSRVTADNSGTYRENRVYLQSYAVITEQQLRYPKTSLLAVAFDAQRFGSMPKVSVRLRGIQVQVPANYDPAYRNPDTGVWTAAVYRTTGTGTTGGAWDGTFKTAWSSNPAWVFYDLCTNPIYGAGKYLTAAGINKWLLYQIAQYCDTMVSDGMGGTEPRFSFNGYLESAEEAFKVLSHVISCARAQVYYAGGQVHPVQDVDGSPVGLFTPSNVLGGKFSYQGSARKARHTQAVITWSDPSQNWKAVPEAIQADDATVARYGLQTTQIRAVGCTSRGQARRLGRWTLLSELNETEAVTFSTGMEGIVARPGDLILIQDPARLRVRMGGRLVSGTTTTLTLDGSVTLQAGQTYTAWVQMPDGSVVSRTVSTGAGTVSSLTLASALPTTPAALAQWLLSSTAQAATRWRVISVKESEGGIYEVVALENYPAKYSLVDSTDPLESAIEPTTAFEPPTAVTITHTTQKQADRLTYNLAASWAPPSGATPTGYVAEARKDNGKWQPMSVAGCSASLLDQPIGTYDVRVVATYLGGVSGFASGTGYVVGDAGGSPAELAAGAATWGGITGSSPQASPSGGWSNGASFGGNLNVNGVEFGRGATSGTYMFASTGSAYDWAVWTPGGSQLIMAVTTGTKNLRCEGSLTVAAGITASGGGSIVGGTFYPAGNVEFSGAYDHLFKVAGTTVATLSAGGAATFAGGVVVSGGAWTPGSVYYNSVNGLVTAAKTGSAYDFVLVSAAGGAVMSVPTGTANVTFSAPVTVNGALSTSSVLTVGPNGGSLGASRMGVDLTGGVNAVFRSIGSTNNPGIWITANEAANTATVQATGSTGAKLVLTSANGSGATLTLSSGAAMFDVSVGLIGAGGTNPGLFLKSYSSSAHYNWKISTQDTVNGAFEIAPSTAVGGTTWASPVFHVTQAGQGYINNSLILTLGNVGSNAATFQAAVASATAPMIGTFAQRPAANFITGRTWYYYATDTPGADGANGALYSSDGASWTGPLTPTLVAGRVTAGTISAAAVGATALAADVALVGQMIRSTGFQSGYTGQYIGGVSIPGNNTGIPAGFALYGSTVTSKDVDGNTFSCIGEFGGGFNFGGYNLSTLAVGKLAQGGIKECTTPGTYTWKCPTGITSLEVILVGAGGSGGRTGTAQAAGGGGGGSIRKILSVTPGTTYTVTVGAGGTAAANGNPGNPGGNTSISGSGLTTQTAYGGAGGSAGTTGVGGAGGAGGAMAGGAGGLATTTAAGSITPAVGIATLVYAGGAGGGGNATAAGSCGEFAGGVGNSSGGASAMGAGGAANAVGNGNPGTGYGSGGGATTAVSGYSSGAGAGGYALLRW